MSVSTLDAAWFVAHPITSIGMLSGVHYAIAGHTTTRLREKVHNSIPRLGEKAFFLLSYRHLILLGGLDVINLTAADGKHSLFLHILVDLLSAGQSRQFGIQPHLF